MSAFSAEVFHNEFLAAGSTQVHAIVTVSSTGSSGLRTLSGGRNSGGRDGWGSRDGREGNRERAGIPAPERVEILLLDCSGSMANPPGKMRQAVAAAEAALDGLPDGTWFAIVRGTGAASMAYPNDARLARADASTRLAARRALSELRPTGGTAIGRWLRLAKDLATTVPDAIRHAILLTDGENGELAVDFHAAVKACAGVLQCDCRGIGADWRVDELRTIATALLGTVDAVPDPADLVAEFSALVDAATRRATDNVSLRVWTPVGAQVKALREVAPTLRELAATATPVNERVKDYRTGAWGVESRDYHLHVEVPPWDVGTEILAARVSLVVDDQVVSSALVPARWTNDEVLSTRTSTELAHYMGQVELARVLREGLEARRSGDETTATLMLGRGAQLARATGNEATYRLLQKVVDIDNHTTGTVRLKKNVEKIDEMVLETRSTLTVRVNR